MKRFIALLAIVATCLVGILCYELHGLNRRLDAYAAANYGWPVLAASKPAAAGRPETRQERLDRRVRELQEASDDTAYVLNRLLADPPKSKPTPK